MFLAAAGIAGTLLLAWIPSKKTDGIPPASAGYEKPGLLEVDDN